MERWRNERRILDVDEREDSQGVRGGQRGGRGEEDEQRDGSIDSINISMYIIHTKYI